MNRRSTSNSTKTPNNCTGSVSTLSANNNTTSSYTSSLYHHHSKVLLRKDRSNKKTSRYFVLQRAFVVLLLLLVLMLYYYYHYDGLNSMLQQQRNDLYSVLLSSNDFTNNKIDMGDRMENDRDNGIAAPKKRGSSSVLKLHTINRHEDRRQEKVRPNTEITTTGPDESLYYFNSIPIQKMDRNSIIALQSSVYCINHQHNNYETTTTTKSIKTDSSSQWISRSCYYRNLCYDTMNEDYVLVNRRQQSDDTNIDVSIGSINPRWNIVPPLEQPKVGRRKKLLLYDPPLNQVIINITTSDRGVYKMKWRPRTISTTTTTTTTENDNFYVLPRNVLLLPFHSMAGHNVGHLLWDDLYPIYSLLKTFGYSMNTKANGINDDKSKLMVEQQQLLLLRMKLKDYVPLYATCDIQRNKRIGCNDNFHKWLPLLNVNPKTFSSTKTINITTKDSESYNKSKIRYICANKAVAGIGMLNDHGWDDHGWDSISTEIDTTTNSVASKPRYIHNLGRGNQFYQFCQLLIHNGLSSLPQPTTKDDDTSSINSAGAEQSSLRRNEIMDMIQNGQPKKVDSDNNNIDTIQITFSINSSRDWTRRTNFTTYIEALQERFNINNDNTERSSTIQINVYEFRTLELHEQIQIMQQTDIFISVGGGGTISSMFLRRNAVVILFYSVNGGYDFYTNQATNQSILLDYDLFSNISHLRIHWFPLLFETITSTAAKTSLEQTIYYNHIRLFVQLIQHEIVSMQHRKAIRNRRS